jgi:Flp pilus assembly protein TadG
MMRSRGERGAVAVEFALLAPLIIILLFAIIEFGLVMAKVVTYVSAAREGARYAAVHCQPNTVGADSCSDDPTLVPNKVADSSVNYAIGPGTPSADVECTVNPGEPVTVSWLQDIPIAVPLLPDMSFSMTVEGTFRCE